MTRDEILRALRPKTLLGYWTVAVFLAAVVRVFLLKGLDLRVFVLFLLPPFFAYIHALKSERRSTQIVAAAFLTAIDFGIALAPVTWLFPKLDLMGNLSSHDNRLLSWYLVVYLLYVFEVLPLFLFIRTIRDHWLKRKAMLSKFTCILGLVAWLIIGPVMIAVMGPKVGLYPVWGDPNQNQPAEKHKGRNP